MKNQPKVGLIYFTGQGTNDEENFAARLLAYTKSTRLNMTPEGWEDFMIMPLEKLAKEIEYMSNTIPSSWEMVDLIFAVNDVSRACAQQITRTRTASFAMQSQRITDMRQVSWHEPTNIKNREKYELSVKRSIKDYSELVNDGEPLENARGVLPINVNCNLVAKYNLRAFVDLVRVRDSLRVQGEYQSVVKQMKALVLDVWPWAAPFFVPQQHKAITLIEDIANQLSGEHRMQLAKAADLLKKG